ncbi:MAG: DUF512 domain-containing protein, partial [Crocosphaera sp.]
FQATAKQLLPKKIETTKTLTWVVGNAVEKAFQPLVKQLNKVENLTINLVALNSEYWGQKITVTGLLTGQDIIAKLNNKELGDGVLLPSLMLKHDDTVFLDDLTVEEVSKTLDVPIITVNTIADLMGNCC